MHFCKKNCIFCHSFYFFCSKNVSFCKKNCIKWYNFYIFEKTKKHYLAAFLYTAFFLYCFYSSIWRNQFCTFVKVIYKNVKSLAFFIKRMYKNVKRTTKNVKLFTFLKTSYKTWSQWYNCQRRYYFFLMLITSLFVIIFAFLTILFTFLHILFSFFDISLTFFDKLFTFRIIDFLGGQNAAFHFFALCKKNIKKCKKNVNFCQTYIQKCKKNSRKCKNNSIFIYSFLQIEHYKTIQIP